jgi:aspartate-semialdehyde dehydrogenase
MSMAVASCQRGGWPVAASRIRTRAAMPEALARWMSLDATRLRAALNTVTCFEGVLA